MFSHARILCAVAFLAAGVAMAQTKTTEWKEIDQLLSEQKVQAALDATEVRLKAAIAKADEAEHARALVRVTQLRLGLHGYETAVRVLREQPWPKGAAARAPVVLYYANTLVTYARAYGWEIRQRERVEAKGPVDLKAWTLAQIYTEAQKAFDEVWSRRADLGTQRNATLAEYLTDSTYPVGIRDTLRDTLSYLRVQFLADTNAWLPAQSNELYKLDLPALIKGDPKASAKLSLSDPQLHPLLRIGAVLDDLEAWHLGAGRKASALEARLERLRQLSARFPEAEDRALLEKDLQARLPALKAVPWFSMGQAQLAEWTAAHDLVRARAVAQEGAAAHPDSVGGKRCAAKVAAIEAPDYSLTAMAVDAPGKRSVQISHKNLRALYFRVYPMDLEKRIATAQDYNLLPNDTELRTVLRGKPESSWTVELPATPDFKSHQTFVTPKLTRSGLYLVAASVKQDFSEPANRILAVNLVAGDLVLTETSEANAGLDVNVWSAASGQPVAGAQVRLYQYDWQKKHQLVDTQTSDAEGLARFKYDGTRPSRSFFLVAKKGEEITLDGNALAFTQRDPPPQRYGSLIYTDRSIYRPLQKILWKTVVYRASKEGTRFDAAPQDKVTVSLLDPNGQVVEKKDVTTNEFGSAAGEFTVPTGRLLGGWTLTSSRAGASGVRVEEYKRPTFDVSIKDPTGALRLNRPAVLTGEARYYFGLPVTSAKVFYRVNRVPVFPYWWGYWYRELPPATTQTVAEGTVELQPDGTFKVRFTPEADERRTSKDVSFRYAVSVDVTDEGGETRSAQRSFRLGWVAVEARVQLDDAFLVAGEQGEARVSRTNLDGVPRAGAGAYRLLKIDQPAETLLPADEPLPAPPEKPSFETPGDKLRSRVDPNYSWEATLRSWKDGAEVARGQLTHDAQGGAKIALKELAAGVYRIRYETTDELGAKFETTQDFIVAGPKLKLSLPGLLLVQRSSVKVGDKARLLVHSGLPSQQILFDVFRGGVRRDRRALRSDEDASLIELPIAEADRGGFSVGSMVTRDHQAIAFSQNLFVPWDDKELQVELSSFRDKIRPGASESWRVTVKGAKGQKETAPVELLAYMYDQALDLFGPHSPPSVTGLYPTRGDWMWRRTNLGAGQTQWLSHHGWPHVPTEPQVYPARLKFIDAYGLGGPGRRRMGGGAYGTAMPMAAAAPEPELRKKSRALSSERSDEADAAPRKEVALAKVANDAAAPPPPPAPAVQVRSNFSESAFWKPQLLLQPDGSATIEFKVPDSVTAWNVWVHAMTRDLRGGSIKKQTRSVKELMVRPYVPRFLRESDEAVLKVVVNNASAQELKGNLTFELLEPETNQSLATLFKLGNGQRAFTVSAGGSASFEFPVVAPKEVRTVAVKVVATSGNLSDGELRPLPVLPSRMHLAQSKFVTLRNKDKRTLTFADLAKNDDASRINEQLVVNVDAQLFYSVLQSLPYLVNYPYECTEQTLNRFVSTGIVSSVYKSYPAVAAMAKQLSERKTPLESFDAQDPNRKMTLEESPWLIEAKGGKEPLSGMVNVLDPRVAQANRDASLAKLKKSQTSLGAFPWFPGGPPSPYMTLYILYGFAKAAEFGIDVPKDVIQRGWQYLAQHYRSEYAQRMIEKDCCWEFLTFLNYVSSSYPDDSYTGNALTPEEREAILAHSFKHWKQHSPYLKGYLALTLKRAGRAKDANLVFDSVMDSAKTTQDEGTFWAQEDRSWLWYNDTIETHAFALRTLMELKPTDARRDGLVQWLLLNKKLNQWKSTRATAEVIYSLVKYLQKEGALGIKEQVKVTLGPKTVEMTFEPDKYTGKKNQIVVPGPEVSPAVSKIQVEKDSKGFAFASATWHFSTDKLPTEERGDLFSVSRNYFKREKQAKQTVLKPLSEGQTLVAGDELEVQLSIRAKQQAEYVHLRDPRAAGLEPENAVSRYKYDLGLGWYEETRDSATNFFFEWLPQGEYTLKYRLRVNMAGQFRVGPATLQSMYAPEFTAYSTGAMVNVKTK